MTDADALRSLADAIDLLEDCGVEVSDSNQDWNYSKDVLDATLDLRFDGDEAIPRTLHRADDRDPEPAGEEFGGPGDGVGPGEDAVDDADTGDESDASEVGEEEPDTNDTDEVWCGTCGEGPMSEHGVRIHHGHADDHDGDPVVATAPPVGNDGDDAGDDEDDPVEEDSGEDDDETAGGEDPGDRGGGDDQDERIWCGICGDDFAGEYGLKRHHGQAHGGNPVPLETKPAEEDLVEDPDATAASDDHVCEICGETFDTSHSRTEHIRVDHYTGAADDAVERRTVPDSGRLTLPRRCLIALDTRGTVGIEADQDAGTVRVFPDKARGQYQSTPDECGSISIRKWAVSALGVSPGDEVRVDLVEDDDDGPHLEVTPVDDENTIPQSTADLETEETPPELPDGITEGDLAEAAKVEDDVAGVADNLEVSEERAERLLEHHGILRTPATDGGDPR